MNPKITLLENVSPPGACQPISAREVIAGIRAGRWPKIKEVRAIYAADGKSARYQAAKHKLPAVIFAGEFSRADDAGLLHHSGLAVVDWDGLGERLAPLRQQAASHPNVYAVFLSPSGDGLKVIFRIRKATSAAEHKAIYQRLEKDATRLFGVAPDTTSDVSRKCYVSYDPDAFLNEDAVEWPDEAQAEPWLTASQHPSVTASEPSRFQPHGFPALQHLSLPVFQRHKPSLTPCFHLLPPLSRPPLFSALPGYPTALCRRPPSRTTN